MLLIWLVGKFILLLSLLVEETIGFCGNGCLKCSPDEKCLICDATSLYVLSGDICVLNELEFCQLSFNLYECDLCFTGYYLESNKKCVQNPSNANTIQGCLIYKSFTRCDVCVKDYYIINKGLGCAKVSQKITNCKVYASANTCSVCSDSVPSTDGTTCDYVEEIEPNCSYYSKASSCDTCQEGFALLFNDYSKRITNFYRFLFTQLSFYPFTFNSLVDLPQCSPIIKIPECAVLDENLNCIECGEGFYLDPVTQAKCLANPPKVNYFESTNIPYCYVHNITNAVVNNVDITIIECKLCYEGYYLSDNNKKCQKHSNVVDNCKILSQTIDSECIMCMDGYFIEGVGEEQCSLRGTNFNCSQPNPMTQECDVCVQSNYVKFYNNRYCAPPILNCVTYDLTKEVLTCQFCAANYYFNLNTLTCLPNSNFDAYCTSYGSDQLCAQCFIGYYIDSLTGKCQSDDADFIFESRCAIYSPNQQNVCLGCDVGLTLTSLNTTCRLYGNEIVDSAQTSAYRMLSHCKQMFVNAQGAIKCVEPYVLDRNDTTVVANCVTASDISTKPYCTVNVVNTTDWKAYPLSFSPTSNCVIYEKFVMGSSTVKCKSCLNQVTLNEMFIMPNGVQNVEQTHLYCGASTRTGSFPLSSYCYRPLGLCGKWMVTGNTDPLRNMTNCLKVDYDARGSLTNGDRFCTVADCYLYDTNYICQEMDTSVAGKVWCIYFKLMTLALRSITFFRTPTWNVTLSRDALECEVEKYQTNTTNFMYNTTTELFCLDPDKSTQICNLCVRGYYPINSIQQLYAQDYVETYNSHVSEGPYVQNCINFDSTVSLCQRCDTGYCINSLGFCVAYPTKDTLLSDSGTTCISVSNENLPDSCLQVVMNSTTSVKICISCQSGLIPIYDFSQSYQYTEFMWSNGAQTFVGKNGISTYMITTCMAYTKLFYSAIAVLALNANCGWAVINVQTAYCMNCAFGYFGIIKATQSGFNYVESCVLSPQCTSTRYVVNLIYLRPFFNCHECSVANYLPTINFYFDSAKSPSTITYRYSTTSSATPQPLECTARDASIPANCAFLVFVSDTSLLTKLGLTSTPKSICVSCLPQFAPTAASQSSTLGSTFPVLYVAACVAISNCASSSITNVCEQCSPGYYLSSPTTCTAFLDADLPMFRFCNEITSSNGIKVCSTCKDGYTQKGNQGCLLYTVSNCAFYVSGSCVQSTKSMSISSNMIYRRFFVDYYTNTFECKQQTTEIPNCIFYSSASTCLYCSDNYILVNGGVSCGPMNVPNCKYYSTSTGKCSQCFPGYTLNTTSQCETSINSNIPFCTAYSSSYCVTCQAGFSPVRINGNTTSICLNITFSPLCEVYDEDALYLYKTLNCLKCRKLTTIISMLTNQQLTISVSHFINKTSYSQVIVGGQFTYTYQVTNPQVRAAFYVNVGRKICQEYGTVPNCILYDDSSFEATFRCLKCSFSYFINNLSCTPRTIIPNCVTYYPDKNECQTYLDSKTTAFVYSTFDLYIIANPPTTYPGGTISPVGIEHCRTYLSSLICNTCDNGYYLYDNLCLNVTTTIPDCLSYSVNGICSNCNTGFILFENKCLTQYASNCSSLLTHVKCATCTITNPFLSSSGSCTQPPTVTNCNQYNYIDDCKFCSENFAKSGGNCVPTVKPIVNCKYQFASGICSLCEPYYILSSDQASCIRNPSFDRNCVSFTSHNICVVCSFGYYFFGDSCQKCETDSKACLLCSQDDPSQCLLCRPGFFMNSNGICNIQPNYELNSIRISSEIQARTGVIKLISMSISLISIFLIFSIIISFSML